VFANYVINENFRYIIDNLIVIVNCQLNYELGRLLFEAADSVVQIKGAWTAQLALVSGTVWKPSS